MFTVHMRDTLNEFNGFKKSSFFFSKVIFEFIVRKNLLMFFNQSVVTLFEIRKGSVTNSQAVAARFIHVSRAYPFQGRSDFIFAHFLLICRVQQLVSRQY